MGLSKKELAEQSSFLSDDPMSRIRPELKVKLERENLLFDVHTHVFGQNDLPDKFLTLRLDVSKATVNILAKMVDLAEKLGFHNFPDLWRLIKRIKWSEQKHLQHIIQAYKTFGYDPVFVTLMMDMRSIWNVKKKLRTVEQQMVAMAKLRDQHPDQVIPFVALDPNNCDMEELFIDAFKHHGFFGVKIYPSLGYLPSHPRLMNIFEICEKKNIPVLTHCSSGKTRASSRSFNLKYTKFEGDTSVVVTKTVLFENHKKETYEDFFNGPENWNPVLKAYPNLKLNLAHFGGERKWHLMLGKGDKLNWVKQIVDLMANEKYPNVYADFSFTFSYRKLNRKLKEWLRDNPAVRNHTLHGSDYFLTATDRHLRTTLRKYLDEINDPELIKQIGVVNTKKYLFAKG
ncbi:MAG: amidohydrolase family protein [Cyclobacteriaceae bacterium]